MILMTQEQLLNKLTEAEQALHDAIPKHRNYWINLINAFQREALERFNVSWSFKSITD